MRSLRIVAALVCGGLVACIATAHPPHTYYLSRPTATYLDSTTEPIVAILEDRTLQWSNGMMDYARQQDWEQGVCLHVARESGDTVWLDSMAYHPAKENHPDKYHIYFECARGWVRLHYHVPYYGLMVCYPSVPDRNPYFAGINLVACGQGLDSLIAYRVKRR